ncbi:DNA primase [Streptomyces sp. NPDC088785]|uniref:DNA primase n=1 Tax=Streptomyces sp. NPDC088785 TaxID=3365897 RepID=UPI00380DAAE0
MNRAALGLAVGAGYFLGRTKKMKLAFAVGTMVAGKKLQVSPTAVLDLVRTQLNNNPQFKEIGGQLRQDFRGVGKAATGAILERQMENLAGRLQSSTAGVRDRLEGVTPDTDDVSDAADKATGGLSGKVTGRSSKSASKGSKGSQGSSKKASQDAEDADDTEDVEDAADAEDAEDAEDTANAEDTEDTDDDGQEAERRAPRKRAPAKKSASGSGERKSAPRQRSRSTAKKTASGARRAPRGGAKGERGNG